MPLDLTKLAESALTEIINLQMRILISEKLKFFKTPEIEAAVQGAMTKFFKPGTVPTPSPDLKAKSKVTVTKVDKSTTMIDTSYDVVLSDVPEKTCIEDILRDIEL